MTLGRFEIERRTQIIKDAIELAQNPMLNLDFTAALKTLCNNEKLPYAAVKAWYHKNKKYLKGVGIKKPRYLSNEQELAIVATCQAFSIANTGLSRNELNDIASGFLGRQVNRKWAGRFLKRHTAELVPRHIKALTGKRAKQETMEDCIAFTKQMQVFFQKHQFPAKAVINFDETLVCDSKTRLEVQRIESTKRQRGEVTQTRSKTIGSIISFISAAGELLYLVYCLKVEKSSSSSTTSTSLDNTEYGNIRLLLEEEANYTRSKFVERVYIFTESGRVDTQTNENILDGFYNIWKVLYPGLDCLVLSDQLSAHRALKVLQKNANRGVFLCSLPANTSHFTQPLDDAPFAIFKKQLRLVHQQLNVDIARLGDKANPLHLLSSAYAMEAKAFSKEAINTGFKNTGIYPFNAEKILERAKRNLAIGLEDGDAVITSARQAALVIINKSKLNIANSKKSLISTGKVEVPLRRIHTTHDLISAIQKKDNAAKQRAAEKQIVAKRKREQKALKDVAATKKKILKAERTCQICKNSTWRKSTLWLICDHCHKFYICVKCAKKSKKEFETHVNTCISEYFVN